jgi:thiopurine S-methyltransferase
MSEDWLSRWNEDRIGWHEPDGNVALKAHWPDLTPGNTVLVPLCGKTVDLLWLAERGFRVSGVELSRKAIEAFFAEHGLTYRRVQSKRFETYRSDAMPITLYCGDFFHFRAGLFDALYDRGALVALPGEVRPQYVRHLKELLKPDAYRLIITLEYEQARAAGPPFSVLPEEMRRYWSDVERISAVNEIDNGPPKFREAGLDQVIEAVWTSDGTSNGAPNLP